VIISDTLNKILKEYQEGNSVLSLSKKYPQFKYSKIYDYIKKNGIEIRQTSETARKFYCNSAYFKEIDTEDKAYWLGFIAADGYISKTKYKNDVLGISLAVKDYSHLEKFKKSISYTGDIKEYISSGYAKSKYSRIAIRDSNVVNDLLSHGIKYNKSLTLDFDSILVPDFLMNHFIRGYFDGDGCITYSIHNKYKDRRYAIKFCGTKSVLQGIGLYLPVKKTHKLSKRKKTKKTTMVLKLVETTKLWTFLNICILTATYFLIENTKDILIFYSTETVPCISNYTKQRRLIAGNPLELNILKRSDETSANVNVKKYLDWAISSQVSNRERFNDYPVGGSRETEMPSVLFL